MYIPFAKQAENALHVLNEWHINNTRRLEIDTESTKRKRQGIEGFFMKIPAIFNNDLNYKEISKQTATMITQQTLAIAEISPDAGSDYFKDDVELVIKDGKLYYLPPTDDKQTS